VQVRATGEIGRRTHFRDRGLLASASDCVGTPDRVAQVGVSIAVAAATKGAGESEAGRRYRSRSTQTAA
jgi:hypothetical protein